MSGFNRVVFERANFANKPFILSPEKDNRGF